MYFLRFMEGKDKMRVRRFDLYDLNVFIDKNEEVSR